MRLRNLAFWLLGAIVVVITILFLLSGSYNSGNDGKSNPPTSDTVNIENMSFNPQSLNSKQGDTVTWINKDNTAHSVTSDDGLFDSQAIPTGSQFQYAFPDKGTFPYHCSIHPSENGSINVQ